MSNIQYKLNEIGERPWGTWKCIAVGDKYITKVINVNPHASLSLQMHDHRNEHWTVVSGKPTITVGDIVKEYTFGQSVDIPVKTKHRLENLTNEPVSVLEVQMGDILDENDITRFEDIYNRTNDKIITQKTKYYIVSGGFDPIHEGHIAMIRESAKRSDGVIVLANSDDWLCRKKGKNFYTFETRRVILGNIRGVIDVLSFDDSDNSACDGIKKARQKYPDAELVFANGGDRTKDNIPEMPTCKECGIGIVFGVGGENKANSSSWILKEWNKTK